MTSTTPRTPVTVADAAEIEGLVTITDAPPGRLLMEHAADVARSTWSLDTALHGQARIRNPILDEVWNSCPWPQPAAQTARSSVAPVDAAGRCACSW